MELNENLHEMSEVELSEVNGGAQTITVKKYTVKKGDTLSGLAHKYGTTVAKIMALNEGKIKDKNHIEVGWVIYIPVK